MTGALFYFLILTLAWPAGFRLRMLDGWNGMARLAASVALAQFFGTWFAFAVYLVLGLTPIALGVATASLVVLNILLWRSYLQSSEAIGILARDSALVAKAKPFSRCTQLFWTELPFLVYFLLFVFPMVTGLAVESDGVVRFRFNFIDSAFHLSIARSFLAHPRFPPMDLNMAGNPLNYHFMADFLLAFLSEGRLDLASTMRDLNAVQGVVSAVVFWNVVKRLLKKPAPAITLAVCAMSMFMLPFCSNFLHSTLFQTPYWPRQSLFDRLTFPYFNFEYSILYLLEPQRSLFFVFPLILLVMDGLNSLWQEFHPRFLGEILWIIGLLPFSHSAAFLVLSAYAVPFVLGYARRSPLKAALLIWGPVALAGFQLLYIKGLTPAAYPGFSGWDAQNYIPLRDFSTLLQPLRIVAFWLSVNGESFLLGGLGVLMAWCSRNRPREQKIQFPSVGYFLAVSFLFFLLINFYRISPNWGDSNKFVMFLNFWLAVIVGQQLARLFEERRRWARALIGMVLLMAIGPYVIDSVVRIRRTRETLFSDSDVLAADWIARHTNPNDLFMTAAGGQLHFVTSLAGRPVLQGIYSEVLPYRNEGVRQAIRELYEDGNLDILRHSPIRYVVVSWPERNRYRLNALFNDYRAVVYTTDSGRGNVIRIYDAGQLLSQVTPNPASKPS